MTGQRLTDTEIATALRAHLPAQAAPGLRLRVMDVVETTSQQRPVPTLVSPMFDADPLARRRTLLLVAALLLALAATATVVGAWRLLQRDPLRDVSLEPPADVQAFVLSSYERLPQLPPLALTWHASDSTHGRVYVDRSGAVRFDRFTSADATKPSSYRILRPDHTISGMATVDSEAVWVEPGHEAIGEDPRMHLRGVLSGDQWPGCATERDPGAEGSDSPGWRYVGLEVVAGRPTHHVACVGDLWIDTETRLILRTRQPQTDDEGQPVSGQFETTEVTDIVFGEQPAALFEPPEGLARVTEAEYDAYICASDLPNELAPGISDCPSTGESEATPRVEPSPTPMPTEPPNSSACTLPPSDRGEKTGPLAWTRASLKEDWPVPVRPEPAGGGSVQPMRLTYLDPMRDAGSDAYPCIDIRWVMANTSEVRLKLESSQPVVDPADAWIAYGVVTDDDRDGVPDWRYGIDNMPADAADGGPPVRAWRTDLHTGRTEAGPEHDEAVRSAYGEGTARGRAPRSVYPRYGSEAGFLFGGTFETTQGPSRWGFEMDVPFYAWASVIVDGRVVATDYAPDAGWLVAASGSKPGGTYRLGDPFPDLSMTVPDGWTTSSTSQSTRFGAAGELRRVACGDLPRDYPRDTSYDADCGVVKFDVIDNAQERCPDETQPKRGASADDLMTYVAGLPGIKEIADVTIDGRRGKQLAYSPGAEDAFNCLLSGYEDVWILDLDGVPLLIGSSPDGDLNRNVPKAAVKAEIRKMVESIHFER
jgi:hypothetical protein